MCVLYMLFSVTVKCVSLKRFQCFHSGLNKGRGGEWEASSTHCNFTLMT